MKTTPTNYPNYINAIYSDISPQNSKYPVGSTIVSQEQFEGVEALFNEFYNWYVPKKPLSKSMFKKKLSSESFD